MLRTHLLRFVWTVHKVLLEAPTPEHQGCTRLRSKRPKLWLPPARRLPHQVRLRINAGTPRGRPLFSTLSSRRTTRPSPAAMNERPSEDAPPPDPTRWADDEQPKPKHYSQRLRSQRWGIQAHVGQYGTGNAARDGNKPTFKKWHQDGSYF